MNPGISFIPNTQGNGLSLSQNPLPRGTEKTKKNNSPPSCRGPEDLGCYLGSTPEACPAKDPRHPRRSPRAAPMRSVSGPKSQPPCPRRPPHRPGAPLQRAELRGRRSTAGAEACSPSVPGLSQCCPQPGNPGHLGDPPGEGLGGEGGQGKALRDGRGAEERVFSPAPSSEHSRSPR